MCVILFAFYVDLASGQQVPSSTSNPQATPQDQQCLNQPPRDSPAPAPGLESPPAIQRPSNMRRGTRSENFGRPDAGGLRQVASDPGQGADATANRSGEPPPPKSAECIQPTRSLYISNRAESGADSMESISSQAESMC